MKSLKNIQYNTKKKKKKKKKNIKKNKNKTKKKKKKRYFSLWKNGKFLKII